MWRKRGNRGFTDDVSDDGRNVVSPHVQNHLKSHWWKFGTQQGRDPKRIARLAMEFSREKNRELFSWPRRAAI